MNSIGRNALWGGGWKLVAVAGAMVMVGGCAADASDLEHEPDGPTGTAQQAFTGIASWGYTATSGTSSVIPNVSDATHTCFLASVGGNLDATNGQAEVHVGKSFFGSSLVLDINPNNGKTLSATAYCVNYVNRTAEKSYAGGAAVPLDPAPLAVSATRRCYLTAVRGRQKAAGQPEDFANANGLPNTGDILHTFKSGNRWYLGGSGNVAGSARCIDVVDRGTGWWAGNADFPILDHTTGDLCFLSGVGGSFQTSDGSSESRAYYDAGNLKWRLKASANKYAEGSCAR